MSENGFQINTDVNVKPARKKRKSKKKIAIRAAFIGAVVLLVFAIAFVIFGYTAPVSSVSFIDKVVKEEYAQEYIVTKFYNKNGKIIKETHTQMSDGAEVWLYNYTYKGDKLVKEEQYCWGTLDTYINYTYENGLLARKETFNAYDNTLRYKEEFYYNSDKTVSLKVAFNEEGPMSEYTYTYSGGRLEKKVCMDISTKNITETTYTYSGKNLIKKTVVTNANKENSTTKTTEYIYDGKGNRVRELDDDGSYRLYKYSYSSKKATLFGDDEIKQTIVYEDL